MLFGKYAAIAMIAMVALFAGDAEAGNRHWQRKIVRKCAEGDAIFALGGPLDTEFINVSNREAEEKGHKNISYFLDGRDLRYPPEGKKYRRRNIRFFRKLSLKSGIAALPYGHAGDLKSLSKRKVAKMYTKSISLLQRYTKDHVRPIVAYVDRSGLTKKVIKYLNRKGIITLGKAVAPNEVSNYNYKSSLLVVSKADKKVAEAGYKAVLRNGFKIVDLAKCIGKPIYIKKKN